MANATVNLNWDPHPDTDIVDFEYQISTVLGNILRDWTSLGVVAAPASFLYPRSATADVTFFVRVRAKDAAGQVSSIGPTSQTGTLTVPRDNAPPTPVANVSGSVTV